MSVSIEAYLEADDAAVTDRWERLQERLQSRFGRVPGLEAILFLIGVQSRGQGFQPHLPKQQKQDLIMEGTCCAFEQIGLYRRAGTDEQGHVVWERTMLGLPDLSVDAQEKLLRLAVLAYFDATRPDPF